MNLKNIFIFITAICHCLSHQTEASKNFMQLFDGCRKQLIQWVGFEQSSQFLVDKCRIHGKQQKIIQLYQQWTQIGLDFSLKHFDHLRKYLKQDVEFQKSLKCLVDARNTQNDYFKQEKKFKYFGKFIKEHQKQGRFLFVQQQDRWLQKGKKLCNYFKAFFQYYYLYVLRPSQTGSTTFLRALTVRSTLFDHQDIAYCVQIETHGTIAQNLQGLDINNIYVKIPQIMNAIRFLKFKKSCQNEKNINMMKKIQERLKNVDIFKIMYHDYEPFVEIAAEKFGTSQIKLLARKFADIIQNPQLYEKYSTQQL